jgi:hypothetical protein
MVANEHQVPATAVQTGQVVEQNDLSEWMDGPQSVGIDKDLIHVRAAGFQGIDQFVGGRTVKIAIKGQMNAVFAFKLENLEIGSHRLPSFLPPTGGIIRLTEQVSSDRRRMRHIGKE